MNEKETNQSLPESSQRLDKWLKTACIFKTRAQATRACEEKRVRLNGQVAKPSKMVKPGDELSVRMKGGKYVNMQIISVSAKNVAKKDARLMYKVNEPVISEESKELLELFYQTEKANRVKYKGRPTKKERRRLEKLKNKHLPWA